MKNKQFIINLVANILAFGTSILVAFMLTPYLINTIGKEQYSFYPISSNFINYFAIITLALNSMASRFITIEIERNNHGRAKIYYSSLFFSNLILVLTLSIPMFLVTMFIDSFMNIPIDGIAQVRLLFAFVFSSMIINVMSSVFSVATFAKNRLDFRSGNEIVLAVIKIVLYVLLFTFFGPSIVFIGLVTLILSVLNLIVQIVFSRKLLPGYHISYKDFDFRVVKELFSSGIWNSLNSLGAVLLLGISLLLSNVFFGASASGELSISQILPQLISAIITMLSAVFLPRIIQIYAHGDKVALRGEVEFSQKVTGIISTVPVALLILFGDNFFSLWVPSEHPDRLQLLSTVLLFPLIIHGNMWTLVGANIASNKIKVPSMVLVIMGFVNIVVTYFLIVYFHKDSIVIPIVSAVTNVLYYLFFLPPYVASHISTSKMTFYPHIFKALIFTVIFLTVGYFIKEHIFISTWFELFKWMCIFGVGGLLINVLFIIHKNDYQKVRAFLLRKSN